MRLQPLPALLGCLAAACLLAAGTARAQGGPPYLTNDPGTPGDGHWEINVASMQTVMRGGASYQVPQLDLNYGVGDRIQLTYEVPYVLQKSGGNLATGWGNGNPGVKWRFFDQGADGWQVSIFPQLQTGVSRQAQQEGLGVAGPRYLLPVEVSRSVGPVQVNVEAGDYVPVHGAHERILGAVVGRQITRRLELDAEIYDDRVYDGGSHVATWDLGGRYQLQPAFILLFMAGRSLDGTAAGQPQFMEYIGLQILLAHYGLELESDQGSDHANGD